MTNLTQFIVGPVQVWYDMFGCGALGCLLLERLYQRADNPNIDTLKVYADTVWDDDWTNADQDLFSDRMLFVDNFPLGIYTDGYASYSYGCYQDTLICF